MDNDRHFAVVVYFCAFVVFWLGACNIENPETELDQVGATLRAWRTTQINDIRVHFQRWINGQTRPGNTSKSQELPCSKKAIVTEMAPPELATHLKLNADRYNTCADQIRLPSQPTNLWIDHVEQGDDDDREDWNKDYFGKGKGRGKKGKGGDIGASKEEFKGTC